MQRVMIVTGSSRGIGAAIARLAAARGYAVAVNYASSRDEAEALVREIESGGGRAAAVGADVAQSDEAGRLFSEVDRLLGPPDVLVNNAGIVGGVVPIEESDEPLVASVFAANVFSLFYCAREAVRRMSLRHGGKGGVIVNMSSAAARHGGLPKEIHYASSKGAVDSFTVGLAREVAGCGIRVNALRPGLIETALHDVHGGQSILDAVAPSIPLGRPGTAQEVAEATLWLASDASSYVHGALIDVSGGR